MACPALEVTEVAGGCSTMEDAGGCVSAGSGHRDLRGVGTTGPLVLGLLLRSRFLLTPRLLLLLLILRLLLLAWRLASLQVV